MSIRILIIFVLSAAAVGASDKVESTTKIAWSKQTQECLECHRLYHPGLVADWEASRHAHTLPENALKLPVLQRRISAETVSDHLAGVAVGCFECHSLNAARHPDNFEHFGHKINLVVTPNDCQTCHPLEVKQYAGSKKAHASVILPRSIHRKHCIVRFVSASDFLSAQTDRIIRSSISHCLQISHAQ